MGITVTLGYGSVCDACLVGVGLASLLFPGIVGSCSEAAGLAWVLGWNAVAWECYCVVQFLGVVFGWGEFWGVKMASGVLELKVGIKMEFLIRLSIVVLH